MKKVLIKLIVVVVTLLLVVSGFNSFMHGLSYKAEDWSVSQSHQADFDFVDGTILIGDTIEFMPKDCETVIIFYPGGLVDEQAYMLYARKLAAQKIGVVICSMPYDLAVLGKNKASEVIKRYPDIKHWYMAGHSLGGAMAGSYLKDHAENFEGLILLAAYSTADLSDTNLKVLSLYGSEDQVMKRDKYAKYFNNLPNVTEIVIEGGNHSGFGNYGHQKGDGEPLITQQQQMEITVESIVNFVNE